MFLDEEPTYGYFPSVYYYQGRVREGMNNAASADSYRQYLDRHRLGKLLLRRGLQYPGRNWTQAHRHRVVRGSSTEDLLVPDVRERAGL